MKNSPVSLEQRRNFNNIEVPVPKNSNSNEKKKKTYLLQSNFVSVYI